MKRRRHGQVCVLLAGGRSGCQESADTFDTHLIHTPRGWVEPPPGPCHLGHPPEVIQHHWLPCRCSGHRAIRCGHPGHRDEDDRYYGYRPEPVEGCLRGVYPTAPG